MVIAPLLLGMFDLRVDALNHRISLAPQLPANWDNVALRNIRLGEAAVDFQIEQKPGLMRLSITGNAADGAVLDYSPTFSHHARIVRATMNGRSLPFTVNASGYDQRLHMQVPLDSHDKIVEVQTEGDVHIAYDSALPSLGGASRGLRLTHESWSPDGDTWTMQFEAASGGAYDLEVVGAHEIQSIEGGELVRGQNGTAHLHITLPDHAAARTNLILHLNGRKR
jgi:hypothetical protein